MPGKKFVKVGAASIIGLWMLMWVFSQATAYLTWERDEVHCGTSVLGKIKVVCSSYAYGHTSEPNWLIPMLAKSWEFGPHKLRFHFISSGPVNSSMRIVSASFSQGGAWSDLILMNSRSPIMSEQWIEFPFEDVATVPRSRLIREGWSEGQMEQHFPRQILLSTLDNFSIQPNMRVKLIVEVREDSELQYKEIFLELQEIKMSGKGWWFIT